MNSNVLKAFYNDPEVVCDPLSAIGHIYMRLNANHSESTIVPVLNRKARILRRLREMSGVLNDLEKTVVLLLGLCALEVSPTKLITLLVIKYMALSDTAHLKLIDGTNLEIQCYQLSLPIPPFRSIIISAKERY
jgi:hypothetical protein